MSYLPQQKGLQENYEIIQKQSRLKVILQGKVFRGFVILTILAIALPIIFYFFTFDNKGSYKKEEIYSCDLSESYRIQCGKENATVSHCSKIQCCFDKSTGMCFHSLPSKYNYHQGNNQNGIYSPLIKTTPFETIATEEIAFGYEELDDDRLKITIQKNPKKFNTTKSKTSQFSVKQSPKDQPLTLQIYRAGTDDLLLTTSRGPLIASSNYWEWTIQLTTEYLFGLGQTLIDSKTTKVIYSNSIDHNTLPIFMAFNNQSYHGLRVIHAGPLEVTVLPSKVVILKMLTGENLELELSSGPSVKDVMEQQRRGRKMVVPEAWTLGVHFCRGSKDVDDYKEVVKSYKDFVERKDLMQYESDCIHENLLMVLQDKEVQDDVIKEIGMVASDKKLMVSVPPQVLYQGVFFDESEEWYRNSSGAIYSGTYLGNQVVYPDWTKTKMVPKILSLIQKISGSIMPSLVLTHNWPLDDSYKADIIPSPYTSQDLLDSMSGTLPWDTKTTLPQISTHNLYGTLHAQKWAQNLPINTFMMSASHSWDSTTPVIIQNVDLSWYHFQDSIKTLLYNSIFGYPLTSIPVCGSSPDFDPINESLCMRWYLMAATSPIFRVTSDGTPRDPFSLPTKTATNLALKAIDLRYQLQWYFYTVLVQEEPIMRPMFYDFPMDNNTFGLVEQYMVGSALLVAQLTMPEQTLLRIYLPGTTGDVWYFFADGTPYANKGWLAFDVVETDWVGFIAGGKIVPLFKENNLELRIALCQTATCKTEGFLVYKGGQFSFSATKTSLIVKELKATDEKSDVFITKLLIYDLTAKWTKTGNFPLETSTIDLTKEI